MTDGVMCALRPFSCDDRVPVVDLGVRSSFKREEFCFGPLSVDTSAFRSGSGLLQ